MYIILSRLLFIDYKFETILFELNNETEVN